MSTLKGPFFEHTDPDLLQGRYCILSIGTPVVVLVTHALKSAVNSAYIDALKIDPESPDDDPGLSAIFKGVPCLAGKTLQMMPQNDPDRLRFAHLGLDTASYERFSDFRGLYDPRLGSPTGVLRSAFLGALAAHTHFMMQTGHVAVRLNGAAARTFAAVIGTVAQNWHTIYDPRIPDQAALIGRNLYTWKMGQTKYSEDQEPLYLAFRAILLDLNKRQAFSCIRH